ncbi:uncharacterized protein KY384_000382 [Bacidia gigantensis]|uniref:uncharacterized protein n=1 Tax=Bacidia gigantensis TaxID=2732470 RepID=UPI001D03CBE2|nr:uncharacterized protein KY384_000382 [Bacidia gigantensis]KAG8526388.1 hypothetical protein KY384_000382 [Bacidia gigantensis]
MVRLFKRSFCLRSFTDISLSGSPDRSQTIRDWVSPLGDGFRVKQKDVLKSAGYVSGADRFLESSAFRHWKDGREPVLWCSGMPGVGKTVLAAFVSEDLYNSLDRQSKTVITSIYCDYKQQSEQTPENLFASLVPKYLLDENKILMKALENLYTNCERGLLNLELEDIQRFVRLAYAELDEVYIVIDALDEMLDLNRAQFLRIIDQFSTRELGGRDPKFRLLITSRYSKDPPFQDSFEQEIYANDTEIEDMVKRYIGTPDLFGSFSMSASFRQRPDMREKTVSSVVSQADGLFLTAKLHLNSLYHLFNIRLLDEALQKLPKSIHEHYQKAWDRVTHQEKCQKELAEQAMWWLCLATRPLTDQELCHALAVQPGDSSVNNNNLSDIDDIIKSCKGLIAKDAQSGVVRLAHSTVQSFLETQIQESSEDVGAFLTTRCLTYLRIKEFSSRVCDFFSPSTTEVDYKVKGYKRVAKQRFLSERLRMYPLLDYAAKSWGIHARGKPEVLLQKQILDFLTSGRPLRNALMVQYQRRCRIPHQELPIDLQDIIPLHVAIGFGLTTITEEVLKFWTFEQSKLESLEGVRALYWAAWSGNKVIVDSLLRFGIKPEISNEPTSFNAFGYSIVYGHKEAIDAFLDHGYGVAGSAPCQIHLAVCAQEIRVLQAYYDSQKDRAARLLDLNKILRIASQLGGPTVLEWALSLGAQIDAQTEEFDAPIHEAVTYGRTDFMQSLIAHNADRDCRNARGFSLLQSAAANQQIFWTRLSFAKFFHEAHSISPSMIRPDILEFLDCTKTCFQEAACSAKSAIDKASFFHQLIEHSDFLELVFEESQSREMIRILLANGADIKERTASQETLLHLAAPSVARMKELLESSANYYDHRFDVNARDQNGRTPLHHAAAAGCAESMEFLIERGADPKAVDDTGATITHLAIYDIASVMAALDAGCDVNALDNWHRTPYHCASLAEKPSSEVLNFLSNHLDVDPLIQDAFAMTANGYLEKTEDIEVENARDEIVKSQRNVNEKHLDPKAFTERSSWNKDLFSRVLHKAEIARSLGDCKWEDEYAYFLVKAMSQRKYKEVRAWEVVESFEDEDYVPLSEEETWRLEDGPGDFRSSGKPGESVPRLKTKTWLAEQAPIFGNFFHQLDLYLASGGKAENFRFR